MFFRRDSHDLSDAQAKLDALDRSLAIIEFAMDGSILGANANFLRVLGYDLAEIKGRHHEMFVPSDAKASDGYRDFWAALKRGEHQAGEFLRLGKGGREVWIEATYNPVLGPDGKPAKVVKFASDITQRKNETSRLLTMIEGMPVAVMTADIENDFRINYLNETSKKTLKGIEEYLAVKVDKLLGSSIDVFHKNPAHQRRLLADPRNLPHTAKIRVGPETLELRVSAINGPKGNYLGPMLTWSIVTDQVKMASEVGEVVEAVNSAVTHVRTSADGLALSAEDAQQKASSVAQASGEMASAVSEISGQIGRISERARQIADQATATDNNVRVLAELARKVDDVVGLIRSIAEKTNLLALNATIEAARAGEAGRGFAVVAVEVKELASQTARATVEISEQVMAIQGSTGQAVEAIQQITAAVSELSQLTTAIAGAIEEQAASTAEMSRTIGGVSQAATSTGQHADSVKGVAADLSQHSERLAVSVRSFVSR